MIITYYGKQFFKLEFGKLTIAINPISKNSKLKVSARFGADIALITTNHPDYNGVDQLTYGDREPFVIKGPGSYETKEIFIEGAMTRSSLDENEYVNTVYSFNIDSMSVAFLGTLKAEDLPKEVGELISEVDVLFIPAFDEEKGEDSTRKLLALANSLSPKIIIPMDYDKKQLEAFVKESGQDSVERLEKLTVKQRDIEGKKGEIIILEAVGK